MLNREDRDKVVALINQYLREDIGAFEFDEQLEQIGDETEDKTVQFVVWRLYWYYDDFVDHKVVASKGDWDSIERLRLLLESDGKVKEIVHRSWSVRQLVAALGLLLLALAIARSGLGFHLVPLWVVLGGVSGLLDYWHTQAGERRREPRVASQPFGSIAELLGVRRRVGRFSKKKYPPHVGRRKIRSASVDRAFNFLAWVVWAPLILLVQSMPDRDCEYRVVTP
jgi:hypothetical protein